MMKLGSVLLSSSLLIRPVAGLRQSSFRLFSYDGRTGAAAKSGLDPGTTAVLFIEYQNEFATEGGKLYEAVKPVMENNKMLTNSVLVKDKARAAGAKILHAPILFSENYRELANEPYGYSLPLSQHCVYITDAMFIVY